MSSSVDERSPSREPIGSLTFEVSVQPDYWWSRERGYDEPPPDYFDSNLLEFGRSEQREIETEILAATKFAFGSSASASVSIREGSVIVEILLFWNALVAFKDIAETMGWYQERVRSILGRVFGRFARHENRGRPGPRIAIFVSPGTFLPAAQIQAQTVRDRESRDTASGVVLWYLLASNAALLIALIVVAIILSR